MDSWTFDSWTALQYLLLPQLQPQEHPLDPCLNLRRPVSHICQILCQIAQNISSSFVKRYLRSITTSYQHSQRIKQTNSQPMDHMTTPSTSNLEPHLLLDACTTSQKQNWKLFAPSSRKTSPEASFALPSRQQELLSYLSKRKQENCDSVWTTVA